MGNFKDLNLSSSILKAISDMGFEETTPIQSRAIPLIIAGLDVIGQAQTGTGKTAAFGIPMLEKIEVRKEAIQGLVVTPTRELAVQVAEEINRIGQFKETRALPIYGGQDINRQIRALKNRPHIIVGTPGRLLDHIKRRTVRLEQVALVVLDEADEMLNMGFIEDVQAILQEVKGQHQTCLFSATMPLPIQNLAQEFMKDPEIIRIRPKEVTVSNIEQYYIELRENQKFDVLCRLLDMHPPELAIVFGRTKRRVDELAEALVKRGYSCEGLHGDLTQAKRDTVLRRFKEGIIDILVATDVAARGLDISGVTHVYNFDIPQDPESYVHRIGRTGRAGKAGLAITFATHRDMGLIRVIEQVTKRKLRRKSIPTLTDAFKGQQRITVERLLRTIEEEDIQQYTGLAQELLEEFDSVTALSAALKLLTKEPSTVRVNLTEEAPPRKKEKRPYPRKRTGKKGYSKRH